MAKGTKERLYRCNKCKAERITFNLISGTHCSFCDGTYEFIRVFNIPADREVE